MKATLVFQEKRSEANGVIIELRIWQVAEPVAPSTHSLKYSLFYGRAGQRVVGFDNERGKGDHQHIGGEEHSYQFTTVEQLLTDFWAEVAKIEALHE